ncbi:hypothetical protein ABK040_008715 [Willaertia magna]
MLTTNHQESTIDSHAGTEHHTTSSNTVTFNETPSSFIQTNNSDHHLNINISDKNNTFIQDDNEPTTPNSKLKRKKSVVAKKKKWHVNAMGEIIFKDHNSYKLMKQIQIGVRTCLSEIMPKKQKGVLGLSDFKFINKMPFPQKGTTRTPPHEFPNFEFYDYAPFPFRHLRERFGIDPSHFLLSLCHETSLSILGTPGKSGALFFFSADMEYMLKTVTKKESKFLRRILPDYYNHVMSNPNTLITRFYGLYSIKPKGGKNVRFLIMNNVFDTTLFVSERYDLKGSTVGRSASEKEKARETPVLKDLDFKKDRKRKLKVGAQMKNLILHQLKMDAEWLESMKIMDYSLLVGIHPINSVEEKEIEEEANHFELRLNTRSTDNPTSDLPTDYNTMSLGGGAFIPTQSFGGLGTSVASSSMTSTSSYLTSGNSSLVNTNHSNLLDSVNNNGGNNGTAGVQVDQQQPQVTITVSGSVTGISHLLDAHTTNDEHNENVTGGNDVLHNENGHNNNGEVAHHEEIKVEVNVEQQAPTIQKRGSHESTRGSFLRNLMPKKDVSFTKHYKGPRASVFQQFHGGTISEDLGDGTREIYYFGIIDLLQKWNNKKQIENIFKGFAHDRSQISAVSPKLYAARFVHFFEDSLE